VPYILIWHLDHHIYFGRQYRYHNWGNRRNKGQTESCESPVGLLTLDTLGLQSLSMSIWNHLTSYTSSHQWNNFRKYWCTPCTAECKKYEKETLKCPPSSNFISYSLKCKFVPATETWPAFDACHNTGSVGDGGSAAIVRGFEAQRSFMDGFSACGIDNPAKVVMSKGFQEHLVKGIIKDDLPYLLGEKAGMLKLFKYVWHRYSFAPDSLTRSWYPVWETQWEAQQGIEGKHTLYMHHMHMLTLFILAIQSNKSKTAIASDLWTSKNSVYAFASVVAFWIANNWDFCKCVLDLLPLSGDHSGKASGKLIFKALRRREIETKLSESCIVGTVM